MPTADEPEVVESEVEVVAEADEFAVDVEESAAVKRGFWRFGRAKSDEDVVAESDVAAWDAAEEFEVAAEADEPVLDEPEVVESEVEVVAEADEFAVDVEESAAVKRGFWRFGRAKSDEDVVAESDVAAWDAAEEFEVAAEADEPVLDEPEVVESEVEVVAEADEFAVDVEESAAVKRGFWRFGRAKSDEDVVAESDVAAWDAAEEFEVAAEADEPVLDEPEVVEPEVEVVAEATDEVVGWSSLRRSELRGGEAWFLALGSREGRATDAVVESDAPAWDACGRGVRGLLPRSTMPRLDEPEVVESEVEVVAEADEFAVDA